MTAIAGSAPRRTEKLAIHVIVASDAAAIS
jgi:hypothetical protein